MPTIQETASSSLPSAAPAGAPFTTIPSHTPHGAPESTQATATADVTDTEPRTKPVGVHHMLRPNGVEDQRVLQSHRYVVSYGVDDTATAGSVTVLDSSTSGSSPSAGCLCFNVGLSLESGSHVQGTRRKHRVAARFAAFQQCLAALPSHLSKGDAIAFPWAGGCSTAEEWPSWRASIADVAVAMPDNDVAIVQRPCEMLQEAKRRVAAELETQHKLAKKSLQDAEPGVIALNRCLMDAVHAQTLHSIPDDMPVIGDAPPSMAATAASMLAANADAEQRARAALESDNQAMNDMFAHHVRTQYAKGEVTAEDVRAATATVAGSYNAARAVPFRRNRRVCLTGLKERRYNGLKGSTDGILKRGRLMVRLDHPIDSTRPVINVTEEHALDELSAEALLGESSL